MKSQPQRLLIARAFEEFSVQCLGSHSIRDTSVLGEQHRGKQRELDDREELLKTWENRLRVRQENLEEREAKVARMEARLEEQAEDAEPSGKQKRGKGGAIEATAKEPTAVIGRASLP